MKLGAYYWDGWYQRSGHWTDRLLNEFAEREPIWGWLGNTVENMEMQIDIAADHGISYFAYDWYYPENGTVSGMNDAVDRFLKAKNNSRMEFCLLVANHQGGLIMRENWEDACRRFMPYLTHERALKIDGKPVIIFFSCDQLQKCLGTEEECRKCLDALREECKKQGLPGCFILGCGGPPRDENGDIDMKSPMWEEWYRPNDGYCTRIGLDGVTGYNYHRGIKVRGGERMYIYPFEELAADHEVACDTIAAHSGLPYMPLVIGGWDCRAWEPLDHPERRSCYSPDKSPRTMYNHVKAIGDWMKAHPDKTVGDLAIVYAWNENGEGGIIEPIKGDNGAILKSIKKALDEING